MNRPHLQRLAEERVEDAARLLAEGRWSAAYYLAGYAVECALKSCVLAYVEQSGVIFLDRRYAERVWTHELDRLLVAASLDKEFGVAVQANPTLGANWNAVTRWNEESRYSFRSETEARELFVAATDADNGVLPWIRQRW